MHRRHVLAAGSALAFGGIAGCLDDVSGGTGDGYGPEVDSPPEERSIDTDSYELYSVDGTDVPLAPIEDAYYWYQRQEARMADARKSDQYDKVRIIGAVLSPATGRSNDPVDDWPKSDRIITYCGCPHHLSGMRAAALIENGYEEVYAIDEGLQEWLDRGYPLEGSAIEANRVAYDITGQSDPTYAGEMVMLEQLDAERHEAAPIAEDGSYTVTLHYSGSPDSKFRLETPDYVKEGTLTELTSDTITA